jgi:hypothetical protein
MTFHACGVSLDLRDGTFLEFRRDVGDLSDWRCCGDRHTTSRLTALG